MGVEAAQSGLEVDETEEKHTPREVMKGRKGEGAQAKRRILIRPPPARTNNSSTALTRRCGWAAGAEGT